MLANKFGSTLLHLRNRLSARCLPCCSIHGCSSPYMSGGSSGPGNASNTYNVSVIGLGQMGHGIAAACASAGHSVLISDRETERMVESKEKIEALLLSSSSKGNGGALGQISIMKESDWPGMLPSADLVIEAVAEDESAKLGLFEKLATVTKNSCILASNTSSLSISDLAVFRPGRTLGLHFFNPVNKMKLVEMEIIAFAVNFVSGLGKQPIRLIIPFWAQAMSMIDRGDADAPTIDKAMEFQGHPMGPIRLADYVGLDIVLSILEGWSEKYGSEISQIPRCLKAHVEKGHLGRKSGQGFYKWNTPRSVKN